MQISPQNTLAVAFHLTHHCNYAVITVIPQINLSAVLSIYKKTRLHEKYFTLPDNNLFL